MPGNPDAKGDFTTTVYLSLGCPTSGEYAYLVFNIVLSDGQCRRVMLLPEAPKVVEDYGLYPPHSRSLRAISPA
ncbi:hypothetical protein [Pyrobaculum sp.]|jgi:hypothetical protein|uniref:hypothetical protein n=1 Tax=Pyrobaculum sp. TaxID=2004705 RepID=UPI003D120540